MPAASDIRYTEESCFLAADACPLIELFSLLISSSILPAYKATSVLASVNQTGVIHTVSGLLVLHGLYNPQACRPGQFLLL